MSAASADVALKRLFDFDRRGIYVLLKKGDAAHDHAGSAIGALEGFGVEESLLKRMQAPGLFESFDGGDRFPSRCGNRSDARTTRRAIEQNRAGTTLSFAAAVFGTG